MVIFGSPYSAYCREVEFFSIKRDLQSSLTDVIVILSYVIIIINLIQGNFKVFLEDAKVSTINLRSYILPKHNAIAAIVFFASI